MRFLSSDYPKLFFFSPQPLCPSKKKNSPKLHVWDIILDFSLFNTVCSQLFSVIKTEGIFLGYYCVFVYLGFLTLLANFGLVTPIPVGIRVLGVKTPLRT